MIPAIPRVWRDCSGVVRYSSRISLKMVLSFLYFPLRPRNSTCSVRRVVIQLNYLRSEITSTCGPGNDLHCAAVAALLLTRFQLEIRKRYTLLTRPLSVCSDFPTLRSVVLLPCLFVLARACPGSYPYRLTGCDNTRLASQQGAHRLKIASTPYPGHVR